jgi:hypothetical protein
MRHSLMNPAFPDIVEEWAAQETRIDAALTSCANDNDTDKQVDGLSDPLLALVARAEIEATRLW